VCAAFLFSFFLFFFFFSFLPSFPISSFILHSTRLEGGLMDGMSE